MATPIDPKTPASKPHGTTKDQVNDMESEGQAQTPGQPAPVESPSADQMQGAPGPVATPDEATPRGGDQDIDTAGTEADTERSATNDPTGQPKGSIEEVSGDTGSGDIVGRTGEQMPLQSHDGLEADARESGSHRGTLNH